MSQKNTQEIKSDVEISEVAESTKKKSVPVKEPVETEVVTDNYIPFRLTPAEVEVPKTYLISSRVDHQIFVSVSSSDSDTYLLGPYARVKLNLTETQKESISQKYSNEVSITQI